MADWKAVRYGDATTNVRTRARGDADDEQLLSVTAANGVIGQMHSGRRDISAADKSKYLVVEPGDVVYNTMRMWQGVSGFSEMRGIVSPAYTVLRPSEQSLDGRFLAHLMKLPSNIRTYRAYSQGLVSDTWNLKFGVLSSLELEIPPLEEQRQVAEVLDTIDETIRAIERIIEKLWSVRTGAIEGQLTTVDAQYDRCSLVDVVSLPSGQVNPSVEPYSSQVLVAPDHILGDGRGCLVARHSARDQGAISGKYQFEAGSVVYSKIRPELRKAWLATFDGLCSADMYPLTPGPGLHGGYLASVILGHRFSHFAVSVSGRSSGMPKVNRRELSEFQIAIPPLDVQETVANLAESYERRIESETVILRKMNEVRRGLADDLLSGRVRTVAA